MACSFSTYLRAEKGATRLQNGWVHIPLLDLVDVATGERAVSTGLGAAHELRLLFEGVTGIHASRAFARLTHLCRADQPNHVRTVVSSTLEISPVDVVLMWY